MSSASDTLLRPKFVGSLTFRGFAMAPEEVERLVGMSASSMVTQGEPAKPGTRPLKRSVAQWSVEFEESTRMDEMIPALISRVGGVENLLRVRREVAPEFLEVDLAMWIKDSEEQEGGFIDLPTVEILAKVGATLSFGFYSRHAA